MRIFLHDEFDPQTSAMLQALYSRSAASVEKHVEKVQAQGSAKFMESYYVGYGHASIGDCGTTTLYLEGVSMLAAKAVQDTRLFSGQESSTRYIDFATQPLIDPIGSDASAAYLKRWISFYEEAMPDVRAHLRGHFPLPEGANEKTWAKAIDARAFDILRGWLPAAATTQTSWTTSLRHAHEHLVRLSFHPLAEVRELAEQCRALLSEKYPSSFGHLRSNADVEYGQASMAFEAYLAPPANAEAHLFRYSTDVDNAALEAVAGDLISGRPPRQPLPRALGELGSYRCEFAMDFGSFRDLQRHRGGYCRMPLLTEKLGMHDWYLDQLPEGVAARARDFLAAQLAEFRALVDTAGLTPAEAQYLLPMGMKVFCRIVYDLPEMVYVAELRAGKTVHPTLRFVAQDMLRALAAEHPKLALHGDMGDSDFSIRRGEQDIVERETV
jgi:thymidylate synthase ThyX